MNDDDNDNDTIMIGAVAQVTRMLAFAAALHESLATLANPAGGGAPTSARMGVAFGEVPGLLIIIFTIIL